MLLREYDAEAIKDEIAQCVAQNVFESEKDSYKKAIELLHELFTIAGGNFNKPDYESILKVLKLIAARQLKKGKDTKKIAEKFKEIAKKIESVAVYT
ncbi:MAG: hypothetical protein N3F66_07290 [Spirochaetes bacterium]|nr:hypothetical protein [Spirochaetota bacterium]